MKKEDQNEPRKGQWAHYVKVNGTYYKKVAYKEPSGEIALNLIATSVATIKEDLRPSDILMIPQYNGFTNVPENDPDKYQRVVSIRELGIDTLLYNLYSPVSFGPTEGEWNNIDKVLRHLFDEGNYQKAILYLKNLYMHPAMRQPILCLFGGQSTGKTTFLQLLKAIYEENMRILDLERIRAKFNWSWAGKLIIGVDEAFCDDNDLQTVKSCLKSIQTNDTITINRKGAYEETLPNFTKTIVCTQDGRLANMVSDLGGWTCPVSTIPGGERDPHILDKIIAEIPAFLEHLIEID